MFSAVPGRIAMGLAIAGYRLILEIATSLSDQQNLVDGRFSPWSHWSSPWIKVSSVRSDQSESCQLWLGVVGPGSAFVAFCGNKTLLKVGPALRTLKMLYLVFKTYWEGM